MTRHESAATAGTGDREPGSRVALWIALRRAHQGGVANLAGHWFDSGRLVPGPVAEALEGLTRGELLKLGEADPESCGVRRITVTETGSAHYLGLCRIHNPHGRVAVSAPRRWAHSPRDQRSHLLTERRPGQIGVLVGVCGQVMLWSAPTSAHPTEPRCPTCQVLADLPPSTIRSATSSDSGRLPAEHLPAGPLPDGGGARD